MPYTVYAMTNTDDTHIYIGSTKNFKKRRHKHMYACKRGDHQRKVQALYNQIGPDAFEFDVLEEFDTKAEARAAEQRWVDYYLAAPEWQLLNIATNDVNQASKNPEVSAKIAASNTGSKRSAATKAKISASQKGRPAPNRKPIYVKWADGTEAEFASSIKLAKHLGCSGSLVSTKWLNGRSTTYTKPKYGIEEIRYL